MVVRSWIPHQAQFLCSNVAEIPITLAHLAPCVTLINLPTRVESPTCSGYAQEAGRDPVSPAAGEGQEFYSGA